MDYKQNFKAIISNHGDETLHQALSGEIERRLPAVPISWQRSFGRPSKDVVLQAHFMKFNSEQLSNTDSGECASVLASKPLLHIFWTSCLDNDKYKSAVKNQIMQWKKLVVENKSVNWLIVHVVYQDNSSKLNKSKINLPRSSVYDKIKSEFGQNVQERCIQLWEPDKETLFTKSGESWDALLSLLRTLLLESFGKNLDSFEDRVRVMREKYADSEWPFLSYFLVHEELALTFQSITLLDDALIQYDEVDALFSQFIINCTGLELPRWLNLFCVAPSNWDGVSVSSQNMESYRELIKSGKASLIDFRNYLFARQCKLLISLHKKASIPSRLMEFIYMVVQEIKLLNIDMPVGSVACWTVLTCMQLFQILETVEQKDYDFQSTYAHMYNYMREKFHYLGHITGLYYNRQQTEDELKLCDVLIAGFGKYPSRKKEMPSSIKLLKASLTSKDGYETLYLDISTKTIRVMTNLNRLHFGMCVGIDLAKFHLQYGRYNDAEVLLEKAWSIYKQQKWEFLYTDVLIPLADCQLKHNLNNRYINSVTLLACAKCLPLETRHYYSNELLKLSMDSTIKLHVIGMEPVMKIQDIRIALVKNKGHVGDCVKATFVLTNELTVDLPCKSIFLVLKHHDLSNPRSFSDNTSLPQKPVSIFLDFPNLGVSVPLLSEEKPKEIPKESLTPSNILKKIKGHRRTWSRNIAESKSNNSQTNSPDSISSGTRSTSIASINTYPDVCPAKKTLFADNDENKDTSSDELIFSEGHFEKCVSLPNLSVVTDDILPLDYDIKQSGEKNNDLLLTEDSIETKITTLKDEDLSKNVVSDVVLGKPLATSSVADPTNESLDVSKTRLICQEKLDSFKSNSNTDDNIFEPELEEEENLDQVLVSAENFTLVPGCNSIELKSEINIEGKFNLHCVNCMIGNLTFYKLLTQLPKQIHSFYIVADPPKVVWTTDYLSTCLLTMAKQRLHVTLLNGPGLINQGCTLQISSHSGLRFENLPSSKIQIYPLERDGVPRDEVISAVMVGKAADMLSLCLPECKPYERVNIYFDVIAPECIETGNDNKTHHEIHFNCLWLKSLVDTSALLYRAFCEPFLMDYETVQKGMFIFVRVTLHSVNPVSLIFTSPKLTSACDISFELLSNNNLIINGDNDYCCILWKLHCSETRTPSLCKNITCQFGLNFRNEDSEQIDELGYFSKQIHMAYTTCSYSVDVSYKSDSLKTSEAFSATVTITRLLGDKLSYRLFLILNTETGVWNYVDPSHKYHEIVFTDDNTIECVLVIDISSARIGCIPAPVFFLAKLSTIDEKIDSNNDHVDILENIISFEYGQVNYKHSGKNIFYIEDDVVTSLS